MSPHALNLRRTFLLAILALVAIGGLLCPRMTAAEPRGFSLGQWGTVALDLPDGWTASWQGQGGKGGPAIVIHPPSEAPFSLLMTPFPRTGDNKELEQAARDIVENTAKKLQEIAVEKQLNLQDLEGPALRGFYVSVTDRTVEAPSAEDFRYMDQGAAAVGALMMTFTVLTNVPDGPERAMALGIVRSARHLKAGPPWRSEEGKYSLALPGKAWRFALALPGFDIGPAQMISGGSGVTFSGPNDKAGMMVSVFLEKARPGWNAVAYRDDYWKNTQTKMPMKRQDVRLREQGESAILEFLVPKAGKMEFNHRSLNAMWVHDGVWIDLHLSKTPFKPEDQALFEQILATAHFEDDSQPPN